MGKKSGWSDEGRCDFEAGGVVIIRVGSRRWISLIGHSLGGGAKKTIGGSLAKAKSTYLWVTFHAGAVLSAITMDMLDSSTIKRTRLMQTLTLFHGMFIFGSTEIRVGGYEGYESVWRARACRRATFRILLCYATNSMLDLRIPAYEFHARILRIGWEKKLCEDFSRPVIRSGTIKRLDQVMFTESRRHFW